MINRCERTIKMHYDYLVVGAGLYGAVFAHEAKKKGKTCLVIEKRLQNSIIILIHRLQSIKMNYITFLSI